MSFYIFYEDGDVSGWLETDKIVTSPKAKKVTREEYIKNGGLCFPESKTKYINSKLSELSSACNTAIEKGTTVQLSDGTSENFSYTLADQANVSEMFNAIVMGATEYPYHANDSDCKMYSAKDIIAIYSTLSSMKTAQITYHNQLKQYVKSLENADEIKAVTYGQELTDEYLEAYNTLIAQAQTQLETVLARIVSLENV